MTSKIFLVIFTTVLLFVASGTSFFQGLSFQRGFEINFKPWQKQPLEFIKENWSPFGVFGKKFAIHKRSLDDIAPPTPKRVPRPAAPVIEHIDEVPHVGTRPLIIIPRPPVVTPPLIPPHVQEPVPLPVPMPIIVNDYPPLISKEQYPPIATNMVIIQPTKVVNSHILSPRGLYTDISRVETVKEHIHGEHAHSEEQIVAKPEASETSESELEEVAEVVPVENPPASVEPISPPPEVAPVVEVANPPEAVPPPPVAVPVVPVPPVPVEPIPPALAIPPPAPVVPVPPPTAEAPAIPPKAPELPKPVLVEEIKDVSLAVPAQIPKTEIVLKENAFVKGSKMALQFGTVFLSLMAQFLDSARASIDIITNPPPKFQN